MPSQNAVQNLVKADVHNFMMVREGPNSILVVVNLLISKKDYSCENILGDAQCRGLAEELIAISGSSKQTDVAVNDSGKPTSITLNSRSLSFDRSVITPQPPVP